MAIPRKYQRGDRVNIPAQFMNDTLDLIRAAKGRRGILKSGNDNGSIVQVKNKTGAFQEANAVLVLDGSLIEVDGDGNVNPDIEGNFRSGDFVLGAATPSDGVRSVCVLITELDNGDIGPAWISGIVPVVIEVLDDAHEYAGFVTESGSTYLESMDVGPFPIRYKEVKDSSTGIPETRWGLVEIGAAVVGGVRYAKVITTPDSGGSLTVKLANSDGTVVGDALTVFDGGVV